MKPKKPGALKKVLAQNTFNILICVLRRRANALGRNGIMAIIKSAVVKIINEQIKNELYSAYLYLSMSAWCESENLKGSAAWLKAQAKEETTHAERFYNYLFDRAAKPELLAIDKPPANFRSLLAIFEAAYEHENKVTKMIENILAVAQKEDDQATISMLKWFIDEQVEEEKQTLEIVCQLKMIGDKSTGALFMLDHQLGKRGKKE